MVGRPRSVSSPGFLPFLPYRVATEQKNNDGRKGKDRLIGAGILSLVFKVGYLLARFSGKEARFTGVYHHVPLPR